MKNLTLNPSQLCILESFSSIDSQEEADELSLVIRDFYAKKLEEELDNLWDDGTFDQKKLDELKGQHLRTPYSDSRNGVNV